MRFALVVVLGVTDAGPFGTIGLAARGEWWWHGELAGGAAMGDVSGGAAIEARLGMEYRPARCREASCVCAGVDLAAFGGDTQDWPDDTRVNAALVVPRVGIQLGHTTCFRLGIELPIGVGLVRDYEPDLVMPVDVTTTKLVGGFALTFGVLVQ